MILALDTETTGADFFHGSRPYLVTTCNDAGEIKFWEWPVNPLTRRPEIPPADLWEIRDTIDAADVIVGQNFKFDVHALNAIGIRFDAADWAKVEDTLVAGHLLSSNTPHDLTSMAAQYIDEDIEEYEKRLEKAVKECRDWARRNRPAWRLAKKDEADMPSAKDKTWKIDAWLPRAVADELGLPADHPWRTVASAYANVDSGVTPQLWAAQKQLIAARKLGKIYRAELDLIPVLWEMEDRGATVNADRMREIETRYRADRVRIEAEMVALAAAEGYNLQLPKAGNNRSLTEFCFGWAEVRCDVCRAAVRIRRDRVAGQRELEAKKTPCRRCRDSGIARVGYPKVYEFPCLDLPVVATTESGAPSLDSKNAIPAWLANLEPGSAQHRFVELLAAKRKKDTALGYLAAYERFMLPADGSAPARRETTKATNGTAPVGAAPGVAGLAGRFGYAPARRAVTFGTPVAEPAARPVGPKSGSPWHVLHPNINQTATDTLRMSSSNPNSQNVSADADEDGVSLRFVFGPAPGREWWRMDYDSLELRIPAYVAQEKELIDLFERADEPPYYGSEHVLNFSTVYPDLWATALAAAGPTGAAEYVKTKMKKQYKKCKGGDFACVPMDTEALTPGGWKTYDQLQEGDLVLGYDDGELRWTWVKKKHYFPSANLVKVSNRHFQAITTPNHRWLSERRTGRGPTRRYETRWCTSDSIKKEDNLIISAPANTESRLEITDDEAALIGFAYGDGSISRSTKGPGTSRNRHQMKVGFRVRLAQKKEHGKVWVRRLLSRIPHHLWAEQEKTNGSGCTIWKIESAFARDLWRRAGLWDDQDFEKFVLGLSTSQRTAFLEGVYIAEGTVAGLTGGKKVITQNKGRFSDGIKLAVFMSGANCTVSSKQDYYGSGNVCQDIRFSKPTITGQRIAITQLTGRYPVWCVTTSCGSWVMRQGNQIMLTGNSGYGAVLKADGWGTADRAFGRRGSHAKLVERFSKKEKLNQEKIAYANRHGLVETLPDRAVDPERGYPIICGTAEWGKISPTVPLNYFVQSTACWAARRALVRCHKRLAGWRAAGFDARMVLYVHDEIVFDLPAGGKRNLPRVKQLQQDMEQSGTDLGIPLKVSVEYCPKNWGEHEEPK